ELNRCFADRLEEARPARAGGELGVRAEQLIPAAGAAVGAIVLGVEVSAGEGWLRMAPAQHVILLTGQFLPPLLIGLLDLGRRGGLRGPGAAHRRSLPALALSVLNTPRPGVTGSNKPHSRRHSASRDTDQVTRAGSTCTAGRFLTSARAPPPLRRHPIGVCHPAVNPDAVSDRAAAVRGEGGGCPQGGHPEKEETRPSTSYTPDPSVSGAVSGSASACSVPPGG